MDVQHIQHDHLEWEVSRNYAFEDNFDVDFWVEWLDKYWAIYSLPLTFIYIVLVLVGRSYMSTRKAFSLRGPLVAWNVAAAAFSIFASIRDVPVQYEIFTRDGLYNSICDDKYFHNKYRIIWGLIFCFSKVPELADTMFIVLRKQNLSFLHFYHHAGVLSFSIYEFAGRTQLARWFTVMNVAVHSLMYSYFAIRAAGYKLPKPIAMSVTVAQITQMIFGTFFVSYACLMKMTGVPCAVTSGRLAYAMVMYTTFGVLFVNFFIQSYTKPRPQKEKVQ